MPISVPKDPKEAVRHDKTRTSFGMEYQGATTGKMTSTAPQRPNPSSAKRASYLATLAWPVWISAICVQCLCAFLISQYDASHRKRDRALFLNLQFPDSIADPSAVIFMNAVLLYGIAVLICYDIRKTDIYQDRILALGVLSGVFVAGIAAAYNGVLDPFKTYMPGLITLSLVLSLAVQNIRRYFS